MIHGIFNTSAGFLTDPIIKIPNRRFMPDCLIQVVCTGKNLLYSGCKIDCIIGGSINFDYDLSLTSALGECVERYAAAMYDEKKFTSATYNELKESGEEVIDIKLLKYYSDKEYEKLEIKNIYPLSGDDCIDWVVGWDYMNESYLYVPAFCIYMPINNNYLFSTSTGLAAGKTLKSAVVNGFFECVERHAFANFWYRQNDLKVPQYTASLVLQYYDGCEKIKQLVDNKFVRFKFFDLVDIVGVETIVTFMYFEYKGKLYQSLGAASRFTKEDAILKATLEAWQGVEYALSLEAKNILPDSMDLDLINNFDQHFHFYNKYPYLRNKCPIIIQAMDWDSGDEKIHVESENNSFKDFSREELRKVGIHNLICKDITPVDVEQLGYHVARVIVPQLNQLAGVHNYPFLGGELGSMKNLFTEYPHPFP